MKTDDSQNSIFRLLQFFLPSVVAQKFVETSNSQNNWYLSKCTEIAQISPLLGNISKMLQTLLLKK